MVSLTASQNWKSPPSLTHYGHVQLLGNSRKYEYSISPLPPFPLSPSNYSAILENYGLVQLLGNSRTPSRGEMDID